MAGAGKGRSTGNNPEDCPVCLTNFDIMQRPHNLPCGHTVCMLCIDKLKEQGRVSCPECRVSHAIPEGGQFPVSFIAEAFIRKMRGAKVAATAASLLPSAKKRKRTAEAADSKEATGFSKKMRFFLQEQEATVVAAITACREAQSQLDQYQTTLTGWGKWQQQLEDRLQGLVDQSRSAIGLVQQEESRTTTMEVQVKEVEQALQATQEKLHTLKTEEEVGVVVIEVIRCTGEAEQVVQECQECFPDANTVTTIRKTKDLRSLSQPPLSLIQAGQVFAVCQVEGQRRLARISFEASRLCLHALKEQHHSLDAATLQVSMVVPPSPPCTVFLDLSWPGSSPRRVQIHLSPDTPWGRQFMMMCTGQHGPSYLNTRLFSVGCKGKPGEYVVGGLHKSNDDTLNEGAYSKSGRAGAVRGMAWKDGTQGVCGLFAICTRECRNDIKLPRVFGEVVNGLHVVAEAAQHSKIEEVTVVDCGVVL